MRILMYIPTDLRVIKGTSLRFLNIAKFLGKKGIEVHVLADDFPDVGNNIIVCRLKKTKNLIKKIYYDLKIIKNLIREIKPSLVYSHTHSSLFVVRFLNNIPNIIDIHGSYIDEMTDMINSIGLKTRLSIFVKNKLFNKIIKRVDGMFVVCYPLKDYYSNFNKNIFVVPGGVDTDRFSPSIEEVDFLPPYAKGKINVMYVGNFRPYQGIELLIASAVELIKDDTSFFFTFIGNHKIRPDIAKRIKEEIGDDNCLLLDPVKYENIPKYLVSADVLVVPRPYSRIAEYAFPSKLPEYISMGKAVIATDIGDHSMVIKNMDTGLLIKPEIKDLKEALIKLKDEDLRRTIGENARLHALRNYSWDAISENIKDIFYRII